MKGADKLISEGARRIKGWRLKACPLCRSRNLARLGTAMWTGIPGTLVCHTFRCRGCGQELFAERDGAPMTMADHTAWRDAKQMRILAFPEFPTAVVQRPDRRSRHDRR